MIGLLAPQLRRAVSPYTGIVRSVEECLTATSDPAIFQATCDVGQGTSLVGAELRHLSGMGGAGVTREDAASAAVGEALERYSATYVPVERLVVATARELGDDAVDPERFTLFSETQYARSGFPYRRFTADTRLAWVEALEVPGIRKVFVPAELVFLGDTRTEKRSIAYATSNGLACGASREETLLRGLCEVLERDAFMIVWANGLTLPRLQADSPRWSDPFDVAGLEYAAIDLSYFHRVPTVLGVVRAPAGFPGALGVGAATAPTIERAWWKALSEAFATRSAAAKLNVIDPGRRLGPAGAGVETFEDHIVYYGDARYTGATTFLDASEATHDVETIEPLEGGTVSAHVEALCHRVEAAGATAYSVDMTSPDVAQLGLTVTRVLAPELCPLEVSHSARFLGGHRLYEAATALGLRGGTLREEDVNPEPHPFP